MILAPNCKMLGLRTEITLSFHVARTCNRWYSQRIVRCGYGILGPLQLAVKALEKNKK